MNQYLPDENLLRKYAQVLVNFALNSGKGIKPGDVVRLSVNESAKPLFVSIRNEILISKAIPLVFYSPDDVSRDYYQLASLQQLNYFPSKFYKGLVDQIDHSISIISETNKHELEGIDPTKIITKVKAHKPLKDWLDIKENNHKFTWTLALFGTEATASEAGMSLSEYWQQIIKGCLLDEDDPIAAWKKVFTSNSKLLAKLNSLQIDRLHIHGPDVDLWVTIGPHRRWLGGSGRNIPSYEVFISPDWRGTSGHIEFNQPLYRYGTLIKNIKLDFKDGRVTNSYASHNHAVLKEMLNTQNADKVGEFSLTDKRLSRIDKFMAETLFDENISGPYGNTHIALGSAYHDSFYGGKPTVSALARNGFNDSSIHTDIISTSPRTVTAHLANHSELIIYRDGEFV